MIWMRSVGDIPHKVTVFENPRRGDRLYLQWRDTSGTKRNWRYRSLGKTLRTADGKVIKDRERWALEQAKKHQHALVQGLTVGERPRQVLRIGGTVALITDPATGLYPKDTMHRREVIRSLTYAAGVWGEHRAWDSIRRADVRALGRKRLAALKAEGHIGVRGALVTVGQVLTVAQWLRDEELIDAAACLPERHWKKKLETEADAPEPDRPRYTLDEMRQLLAVSAAVDPRFHLLLFLGAELRLGQVARALRTDLSTEGDEWTLEVRGRGKKRGTLVVLTETQRAVVASALTTGYLSRLERERADYPLFPAGQLKGARKYGAGMADATNADKGPVSRRPLGYWLTDAEHLAGIEHVPGRLAYGIRRVATDGAIDLEVSADTLKAHGGWADTQIPDRIYRERQSLIAARKAADARSQIRGEKPETRRQRVDDLGENETPSASESVSVESEGT